MCFPGPFCCLPAGGSRRRIFSEKSVVLRLKVHRRIFAAAIDFELEI
jgi:hypothetical protein